MNKVLLVGRLTKDPELKKSNNNLSILNFTVAINRTYKNKEGQIVADFINCVAFSRQAENMATYTSKGSLVSVEGRIQTRNYEDATGKRVYVTEVVAENIQFLARSNSQGNKTMTETSSSTSQEDKFFDDFNQFEKDSKDILSDLDISDDSLPF
ncbi:MAG: single-stranded DNA-binding protein [Bacilli bacterium]|jgi:single-strand DNA-binding protein|nr:single-stranded DNA-binding protein [Bacilli bacterium]